MARTFYQGWGFLDYLNNVMPDKVNALGLKLSVKRVDEINTNKRTQYV